MFYYFRNVFIACDVFLFISLFYFNFFLNFICRRKKLDEVEKHERLPPHSNCVRFYRAWEERLHLYIQTELCLMRYVLINSHTKLQYVNVQRLLFTIYSVSFYKQLSSLVKVYSNSPLILSPCMLP